ncbi:MAG: 3-deoxy-7-phosphoheptulonate synthase [Bryobacteraceae bacterium]
MVVVMEVNASEDQIEAVIERMIDLGFNPSRTTGQRQTLIAGVGVGEIDLASFNEMDGVREAYRISSPYKLASRVWKPERTRVALGAAEIGGARVVIMARPAKLDGAETCKAVAAAGAAGLVVGAAKARYGYEAVTAETLAKVRACASAHGLFVVAEVTEASQLERLAPHCDGFQVGASQMQNYGLLAALGSGAKPVILERAVSASLEDALLSAEAVLQGHNPNVILCERGMRTFDASIGTTMDIAAIPTAHKLSHLPIVADPLRGVGRRDRVLPMARAAVAAGVDGLILDFHAEGNGPAEFREWVEQVRRVESVVPR